eukprot:365652-Chlamydomonas_euryale.AAC.11
MVRYLSPEELPHYEVVVQPDTGMLMYKVSGQLLHTFLDSDGSPGVDLPAHGAAPPCGARDGAPKQPKWIWVVAPSGRLYVAPKLRGQFHHSSFLRGAAVLAAGNMMAEHGRLVRLTADSGHYWPQPDHFRWFYDHLMSQGADMSSLSNIEFRTKH